MKIHLSKKNKLALCNRFSHLCDETLTRLCPVGLIQANQDRAKSLLPKGRKRHQRAIWNAPKVEKIRSKLHKAHGAFDNKREAVQHI